MARDIMKWIKTGLDNDTEVLAASYMPFFAQSFLIIFAKEPKWICFKDSRSMYHSLMMIHCKSGLSWTVVRNVVLQIHEILRFLWSVFFSLEFKDGSFSINVIGIVRML